MTTKIDLRTLVCASLAFVVIFALGTWLGLFETYGGYVYRRRAIQLLGLGIGAGCGVYWLRRSNNSRPYLIPFLFISWLVFQAGDAIGQALYFGPSSLQEFGRLIALAIGNEL